MKESEVIQILKSGKISKAVYDWIFDNYYFQTKQKAIKKGIPISDATNMLTEAIGDTIMKIVKEKIEIFNLFGYISTAINYKILNFHRTKVRHGYEDLPPPYKLLVSQEDNSLDDRQKRIRNGLHHCIENFPPLNAGY